MSSVSGTPSPAGEMPRFDIDAAAKEAYGKLDTIGSGVRATANEEVAKVRGAADILVSTASISKYREKALKDGLNAAIQGFAAAAARAIVSKHPNAKELGDGVLTKLTTAIMLQAVVADLGRAVEASKVFGEDFPKVSEAFYAGIKAAYGAPLTEQYPEIEVTQFELPPQPEPPAPEAPAGEAPAGGGEKASEAPAVVAEQQAIEAQAAGAEQQHAEGAAPAASVEQVQVAAAPASGAVVADKAPSEDPAKKA